MRRAQNRLEYVWLALCVIAQAVLLTHKLALLPMWNDELFTVQAVTRPVRAMLQMVRGDVHPPLYFLLAHAWEKLSWGETPLLRARLLSVIFTLLATVAIDRLWLRDAPRRMRWWFLALWITSSCLLLYARMARSYSLQVLLFVVVCWAALQWSEEIASTRRMLIWAVALAALLYTHYVPGIAAWAGCAVLLFRQGRARRLLMGNALVVLAYLPWLATLVSVASLWQARPSLLLLTRSRLLETGIKLGYWGFSFLFGEAIPVWMLPVAALLAIPALWLLWEGVQAARTWILPVAVAAAIGFAGVAGWVTYAFGPARLLFLLPLLFLAMASAANSAPRAGMVAAALLAANVVGIGSYFQARDVLNIGYLAPMDRIAGDIAARSSTADTMVLVDGPNLSGGVLEYYLPGFTTRQIFTVEDAEAARREVSNPAIRHVWFLRNPHDVTPDHVLERLENDLRGPQGQGMLYSYGSFSPAHLALMRMAGVSVASAVMYPLWEFRKPD
ncbi:MAG TPA: hypothetical protein VGJ09_00900 [Bryobacteraceae bacterium]